MNETRKPRLRWYQFTLRSLCLVMFLACIGMSWVSVKMQQARRQKGMVEAIETLGGSVGYDYDFDSSDKRISRAQVPGPHWLRNLLGDDVFRNVTLVNLYDTQVKDADLGQLEGLTQVRLLMLHNTQVTDAGLEHLGQLAHLHGLALDNTQVTDAGVERLGKMTQLHGLSLARTHVTDVGLGHLKGLTQLTGLSFHHTQITDAGLELLTELTRLQEIWLSGTQVTDDGVKKLQRALPTCKIYR